MKPPRQKIPATPGARGLLEKLEALAWAPGTEDEGKAAKVKLDRLKAKYDFMAGEKPRQHIFSGNFARNTYAERIATVPDLDLGYWALWAIEKATGIKCCFRSNDLHAYATQDTAHRLTSAAETIIKGFMDLWAQFQTFPTIHPEDREIFWRGLYDGMMSDRKPEGEPLPTRAEPKIQKRTKRKAVAHPVGIGLHPYAVAIGLGEQLRFNVPVSDISNQLEEKRRELLAA